ncbi:MAG: hypothetical protein AB7U20_11085 [Planctomycetaceae bacterium]
MTRLQRRSIGRSVGASIVAAVAVVALGRAEDPESPSGDPPPAERTPETGEQSEPIDARPQRVIVLSSGRIVLGDVVERPGGYLVREQFGSTVVPFTQVLLTAADLPDAYRKLSQSLTSPTAGKHVALAKWCYENRLYDAAQVEIKRALLLEPERKEAREFLQKLQRTMESGLEADVAATGHSDFDEPIDPAFPGQAWKSRARQQQLVRSENKAASLAGLAPETVEGFVQQVQPLLMNKCGNARCHGQAATNDFRLTPVRRGMSGFRVFTEKNLSSVLKQIDVKAPETSPLLSVMQGSHGDTPRPLFLGPSAEQQQATLRQWVLRAAIESGSREPAGGSTSAATVDTQSDPRPTRQRDPFLEQILAEDRPDVFDPDVFNRIVHQHKPPAGRSE